MSDLFLPVGALLAGVAVAFGAFGAHGLKPRLTPEKLLTFETGVRYHFYHAFALLLVGVLRIVLPGATGVALSGWLFVLGIVLFSGSLYWLTLGGPRWLGPVTPIGGLALIGGWGALFFAFF